MGRLAELGSVHMVDGLDVLWCCPRRSFRTSQVQLRVDFLGPMCSLQELMTPAREV